MAIYHFTTGNVSRGRGSATTATLSYITATPVRDERLGETFSFGREERVMTVATILPPQAPKEWSDPEKLFNAIEKFEQAQNARPGKKMEAALPREFDLEKSREVVEQFIRTRLTEKGYCATYAIHDDPEHGNPHVHILVANRQLDEKGEWSSKRTMAYALDEKGERIPVIDKATGEQKTDARNRKQWKRISVEVNPLDTKAFLKDLRASWAEECNRFLEPERQIDHRSYAERGIEQIPTVHEGYAARAMEERGEVSERCQENREIAEKNRLIETLKNVLREVVEKIENLGKEVREVLHEKIGDILQRSRDTRAAARARGADGRDTKTDARELRAAGRDALRKADNLEFERAEREAEQERLALAKSRGEVERRKGGRTRGGDDEDGGRVLSR